MVDYSVTNYNPYNMYQNRGYYYPSFNSTYIQQYQNVPLCNFNTLNYNYNNQTDTVSFRTNSQIQSEQKKQGLSTGVKVAIGAGIATILAVGADFVFCKGKHVKSIFGKTGNKGGSVTDKPSANPTSTTHTATSSTPKPPTSTTPDVNSGSVTTSTGHRIRIGEIRNPQNIHHYRLYNRTPEELKQECDLFKQVTGAELHVPDTMASVNFGTACSTLERCAKDGNFPADIKHVLVGHGYGSSVRGDWSIIGRGGNVYSYIGRNPNIKNGEKVLVLCCESGERVAGRNAIGDSVQLSLIDRLHPAKIVVKGENKVAGEFYIPKLIEDDTLPIVRMYSD